MIVSGRYIRGDFVDQGKPQASVLATHLWQTESLGRIGALVNLVYQERAWREDQFGINSPRVITVGGQSVLAPNGSAETVTLGERERAAGSIILQWQPNDRLDLYAELHHAQFKTKQNGYQQFITPNGAFSAGSVSLFDGTSDVSGITWTNPSVTNAGAARDTVDRTTQLALGGSWVADKWQLKADVSHTHSFNKLFFSTININGTSATYTQNIAAETRSLSPPTFTTSTMAVARRPFDGSLDVFQLDGEYDVSWMALHRISAGVRYARRNADNTPGQTVYNQNSTFASASGLLITNPYNGQLVADPELARDPNFVRSALGISAAFPSVNPLGSWDISERTMSEYAMLTFQAEDKRYEGNIGIRNTHTYQNVDGFQTNPSGGILPIDINSHYSNFLPSTNWRFNMGQGVYLRAAMSKTLTRPDFNQISPSLTLNTVQFTGSAGNPSLKPIRAENYDWGVEYYADKTTMMHMTHFTKHVDGFITTLTNPESINGVTYQVSRPFNTGASHIDGWEVGYQQFYDFLPDFLRGFGLQANYTHIDSRLRNVIARRDLQLPNLSRDSYNLVGMYERGELSARLAYNWRSKFLINVLNVSGFAPLPVYTAGYGWMDASVNYHPTKWLTLGIEGLNLLNTNRKTYAGNDRHPLTRWQNDRQLSVVVTLKTY